MTPTDSPPSAPTIKPKRRRLRFSLRGLMVLVLAMGCGLGYIVHLARVQHDAVAAITRTGGRVAYQWQFLPNGLSNFQGRPWAPDWLVASLGPDYFGPVVYVHLGEQAGDAEMAQVGRLPRLVFLELSASEVTDAGLVHLARVKRIDHLERKGALQSSTPTSPNASKARLGSL